MFRIEDIFHKIREFGGVRQSGTAKVKNSQRVWPMSTGFKKTAPFDQPRPLGSTPTHKHGAVDIAPVANNPMVIAPEKGTVYFFAALRSSLDRRMSEIKLPIPFDFKNSNYFYDTFGGVILLISDDKERTYIMTHSWMNQLFNTSPLKGRQKYDFIESDKIERFPVNAVVTRGIPVNTGDELAGVGSAGFSTGRHIHLEVHNGTSWNVHEDRIDFSNIVK